MITVLIVRVLSFILVVPKKLGSFKNRGKRNNLQLRGLILIDLVLWKIERTSSRRFII